MPIRERLAAKEIHRDWRRLHSIGGAAGGGVASHTLLGIVHSDAAIYAPTQGALIVADSTPEWTGLAHPLAAGYALTTDATDTVWDQTPTWTGRHSWDDGGGVTAYIDEDGSADFDGHVAIGDAATVALIYALYVDEEFTDLAGTVAGQYTHVDFAPAGGFSTDVYGILFSAELTTAQARAAGGIYGVAGQAVVANGIAATNLNMIGGRFATDVEDAAALVASGADAYTPAVDAGSATLGYGVRILEGAVGGGSITTLYGLHIAEISAGGTSWAIYSDGGDSYHEDRVKIGGAASVSAQLHVDQSNASGAQPALLLDQGDVSEQHIVCSMDGADQDYPAILQLDVTGTPTMGWDESDDKWTLTKNLSLLDGDLYIASGLGIIHADSVAVGQILGGDGTRFVPVAANANYPIPPGNRGDIIRAEAGPVWAAYGAATLGAVLIGDGTDIISDTTPTLVGALTMDDGAGNSPQVQFVGGSNDDTAMILLFDDAVAGNSDLGIRLCADDADSLLLITNASLATVAWIDATGDASFGDVNIATGHGIIHADGVAVGQILLANGTRYVPATAAGNVPVVPSGRGYILRSNAVPAWEEHLANTLGAVLIGDGTDVTSDTTPTLVGNLTMDDGAGDSPSVRWVGGSNDDLAQFWLVDDAVAGNSDFALSLCADDADSQFLIRNASLATVAWIDALGNAAFAEYISHDGDTDTYLRYQDDQVTIAAGGVSMVDAIEGAVDYVDFPAGLVFVDRTNANAFMTQGINIDQAGAGDHIFSLNSNGDVAHGMTAEANTECYAFVSKFQDNTGGFMLTGLKESGETNAHAIRLRGFLGEAPQTTKTAASYGVVTVGGWEKDGTTVKAIAAAGSNLFSVDNNGDTVMIIDIEGDIHLDAASGDGTNNTVDPVVNNDVIGYYTFDAWDDAQLVRALDVELHPDEVIRSEFDEFVQYGRADLERARIVSFNDDGHHFVNTTQLQRLHNGAIWQLYQRCQRYERALIELGASPALLEA